MRFFRISDYVPEKGSRKEKKNSDNVPDQETVRKTALELRQMLRAKSANSIFVTSAAPDEGKTDITVSLARELARSGKSVIILETDPEKTDLQEKINLEVVDIPDKSINVVFADKDTAQDDFSENKQKVELIKKMTENFADIVLVDGCIWNGGREELSWIDATEATLAVCRQDKANFYAIDRMMTDLQENDPGFLGCVLYGF